MVGKSKLTIKQQNFVKEYIKCSNASEAYRRAYNTKKAKPESVTRSAYVVLHNVHVAAMIEECKRMARKECVITIASQTKKLEDILNDACGDKQYSPAISAVMGQAKLHGLLVDRGVLDVDVNAEVKIQSSEVDLAKKIAFALAKAAASKMPKKIN